MFFIGFAVIIFTCYLSGTTAVTYLVTVAVPTLQRVAGIGRSGDADKSPFVDYFYRI